MPSSVRSWGHVLCRGRASWPVAHLFVVMHTVRVCVHVCAYVSLRQRDGTERTTEAESLGEAVMCLQWDLLALRVTVRAGTGRSPRGSSGSTVSHGTLAWSHNTINASLLLARW